MRDFITTAHDELRRQGFSIEEGEQVIAPDTFMAEYLPNVFPSPLFRLFHNPTNQSCRVDDHRFRRMQDFLRPGLHLPKPWMIQAWRLVAVGVIRVEMPEPEMPAFRHWDGRYIPNTELAALLRPY